MGKFYCCMMVMALLCLWAGSELGAADAPVKTSTAPATDAAAKESAAPEKKPGEEPVWVGVQLAGSGPGAEGDYLIGTIEKATLDAIELNKYNRRFVRISNLRDEDEDEYRNTTYVDAEDRYDWGIILVLYDNIESIQFKKGDPLTIPRERNLLTFPGD